MSQPTVPLQVRLTRDDLEWLRATAKANQRSIAQEFRYMIQTRRKRSSK